MILAHTHPLSTSPPPPHHPLKLSLLHSITKVHNPAINFLITWQEHIFWKDNSKGNTWYLAFSVPLVSKIIPRSQELEIYLESCKQFPKFPYLKECPLIEVSLTFDRFHLKSGSQSTLEKVHVQLSKFLKIALLKNFKLSGMYMYSFLWFEFNHWFGSIYKIKIFNFLEFLCSQWRHVLRCQGSQWKAINGSFHGIGWAQEFLEVFSWRADAQIHIQELRCSTPLFSCLCHC